MGGRRTNLALLAALAVAMVTGVAAFAVGTEWNRWVTVSHGVAGLAVVVLVPWKSMVVRRGVRRRGLVRALPSLALAATVVVTIGAGVVHATGTRHLGPLTAMQVHVGGAVVSAVLAAWHVAVRPQRPHRTDLSRRQVLRTGALVVGGAAAYGAVEVLLGADRRFTGSHEVGSGHPARMPVTQWFDDDVPRLDAATWSLRVADRTWSYDELAVFDERRVAVLDCTGGWWSEQTWAGIPLDRLLAESGAGSGRSVVVRSSSGYSRRFPAGDADRLLVATRLGGSRLSSGHGFPARLVAPGRRGFWWVKWVTEIDVSDRPWWIQLPFPIT